MVQTGIPGTQYNFRARRVRLVIPDTLEVSLEGTVIWTKNLADLNVLAWEIVEAPEAAVE